MANIPKSSIKTLVKRYYGANITEDGANELARIIEKKAKDIAGFAVRNAKSKGREKVTKDDIKEYLIKGLDE